MGKTALVIMAAGIGSRFGKGIKQLEKVGPSGEIIMDYSVHDALEAGFDQVVFIIRRDIEKEFREIIGRRMEERADVSYVFQDMNDLPAGFEVPEGRRKPWGTGQAVLAARGVVKDPFAVINADDYYGKDAFSKLHAFLAGGPGEGTASPDVHQIAMVAFRLGNTLSEHGGVTRGICSLDEHSHLIGISETKNLIRTGDGAGIDRGGSIEPVPVDTLVSMNMWGMYPSFISELEKGFSEFLSKPGNQAEGEYLLPIYIDSLLKKKQAEVTVLHSDDAWFGVTYQEDKAYVAEAFRKLTEKGVYPENLYGAEK